MQPSRTSGRTEAQLAGVVLACLLAVDPWGWDRFGPLRFLFVSALGFAAIASAFWRPSMPALPVSAKAGWSLLLGGMVLSTIGSDDRWHALIGTPDRHFGLLTWALCGGLYLVALARARSALETVSLMFVIGAIGSGLWSIAELSGVDGFDLEFAASRAGGPFGQPAYLGAAMVMAVPVSVGEALLHDWRRTWRGRVGMAGVILGTVALAASQSRAAWVGLAMAAVLTVGTARLRIPVRTASILLGLLAVLALVTPLGARAWSLTDVDDGVVAGRVDEWQVGVSALFDSGSGGMLGLGPEGYRTRFGTHVDEQYVIDHGRDTITDRAHNGLLDTALAGGLVSAVGLAVLYFGVAASATRAVRSADPLAFGVGVASLAYIGQQLFLFPLAELDPAFWILAGLLAADQVEEATPPIGSAAHTVILAMSGLLALVALIGGALDVLADHRIDRAVDEGESRVALAAADDARSLRPDSIRYHFIAARIASQSGSQGGLEAGIARIDDALDVSPNDPAALTEQGVLLLDRARLTDESTALMDALEALEHLDRVDPNHPGNQQRYGIALALDGQTEAAMLALEHAAKLAHDDVEPLLNLAVVQLEAGDLDAGLRTIERARILAPSDLRLDSLEEEFRP